MPLVIGNVCHDYTPALSHLLQRGTVIGTGPLGRGSQLLEHDLIITNAMSSREVPFLWNFDGGPGCECQAAMRVAATSVVGV
jgi:hypothetical protein